MLNTTTTRDSYVTPVDYEWRIRVVECMDVSRKDVIHFIAGGIAGTAGAAATCPLEVVKTRIQSSTAPFGLHIVPKDVPPFRVMPSGIMPHVGISTWTSPDPIAVETRPAVGMWHCICRIKETEGYRGLFKGLGPNLMGIIPAKAIYFFTYAKMKAVLNEVMNPDTPLVHICSSFIGGFTVTTMTSPIWLVKTRLQLDQNREGKLTVHQCVRRVYQQHGLAGFYKGVTASYIGISETVIQFVFYEELKTRLHRYSNHDRIDPDLQSFVNIAIAGSISKAIATCIAYPHEVVRTRLREEGTKYHSFSQTFSLILHEEGKSGLYRGLATQLFRQLPNSAIIMVTYESVIKLMQMLS